MSRRTTNIRRLSVIAGVYVIALALDLFILPSHFLVSTLYAIPILIAAISFPPLAVGVVSTVSLFIDLVTAIIKREPASIWPYELLSLAIVAYLAVSDVVALRVAILL